MWRITHNWWGWFILFMPGGALVVLGWIVIFKRFRDY